MGLSLKKVTKSVSKAASSVTKAVAKPVEKVVQGTGNFVQNPGQSVQQNFSDFGQGYTDFATLGNKKLVDQYTGGFASSTQGAWSGNTKDLTRVGATAAAAYGGPAAVAGVNSAFANGGNIFNAAGAYIGSTDLGLGNFGGLASSVVSSFGNQPKQSPTTAGSSIFDPFFSTQGGYDSGIKKSINPMFIFLGIAALGGITFLLVRR